MGSGAANGPTSGDWYYGLVTQHNAAWVTQRLYRFAGEGREYIRHLVNGTWGAWMPAASAVQTGIFQTGALSNATQYGWNVWFPVPFRSPPIVLANLSTWTVHTAGVHGPWCQNVTTDRFDLYLFNDYNGNDVAIRWLAMLL